MKRSTSYKITKEKKIKLHFKILEQSLKMVVLFTVQLS